MGNSNMNKKKRFHDEETAGMKTDKKNAHRKERRVFNANSIKRYYENYVEPALKEEEEEDERQQRELAERNTDDEFDSNDE